MKIGLPEIKIDEEKILNFLKKNRYVLIVMAVGLILLFLPWGGKDTVNAPVQTAKTGSEELLDQHSLYDVERRMEKILSRIQGAGEVTVMLTLKNSGEKILASDEEMSTSGIAGEAGMDRRSETVIVGTGQGIEAPVTVRYAYPEYQGALVVSEGAGSPTVKLQLTEAVSNLTGLGVDKITVTKMQEGK